MMISWKCLYSSSWRHDRTGMFWVDAWSSWDKSQCFPMAERSMPVVRLWTCRTWYADAAENSIIIWDMSMVISIRTQAIQEKPGPFMASEN